MAFNFEEFTTRRKAVKNELSLTLYPTGRVSFNHIAYEQLGQPQALVLLYDRQQNVLGLRPAKRGAPNSYTVDPTYLKSSPDQAYAYRITAKAALRHFGIPPQSSHFTPIVTDGVLITDLNQPNSRALTSPEDTAEADLDVLPEN